MFWVIPSSPGGQSTERTDSHDVSSRTPADKAEGLGQRTLSVQLVVRHHHGESGRHAEVGEKADEQRGHDANRYGAHGVLCLFAWAQRGTQSKRKMSGIPLVRLNNPWTSWHGGWHCSHFTQSCISQELKDKKKNILDELNKEKKKKTF